MYYAIALYVLLSVMFISVGLYFTGSIMLLCGVITFIVDKIATHIIVKRCTPKLIPSTADKLVEHDAECTQPKLHI